MDVLIGILLDWLKIVWNGPFHIGPLSQPVSVGDVLLKVLETIWRAFISLVYLALLTTAVVFLWTMVVQPVFYPPAKKYALASAEFDDGSEAMAPPPMINVIPKGETAPILPPAKPVRCTPDYPLKVSVWNTGRSPIQDVSVSVTGSADGMTAAIVDVPYLVVPRIIAPDRGWIQCYALSVTRGVSYGALQYQTKVIGASYASVR